MRRVAAPSTKYPNQTTYGESSGRKPQRKQTGANPLASDGAEGKEDSEGEIETTIRGAQIRPRHRGRHRNFNDGGILGRDHEESDADACEHDRR